MRKLALYIILLIILLLISGFVIFLKKIHDNQVNFNYKSDGIAVLTGGKGRINLGLELFNKNRNLRLIISGVDKKVSNKSIIPNDIKNKSNITIDKESESTYQNAKIINDWASKYKLQNITIITSYYHMPRSMMLMQSLTPTINFYAYPVEKTVSKKTSFTENTLYYFFLTEEYIKYLVSHFIIIVI
ncbi:YdcF family protein [Alphaproteobacteria bacterium]|nr:YdcF family protein [Alphaproteobacteria bacterium]